MDTTQKRFAVGFSFPGEYMDRVRAVADILAESFPREQILFPEYHEAEFARPNYDTYLQQLYLEETQLVIVFTCHIYSNRSWNGIEWRALRSRRNLQDWDSIMFLQIDEGTPDDYFGTIDGSVDVSKRTPEEIAKLILNRYRTINARPAIIEDNDPYSELNEYLSNRLSRIRDTHPSFRLMVIDDLLFPDGVLELYGIEAVNDANELKTIPEIMDDSWSREKNHLMIEGEGGIGKTVTLLSLPDKFTPHRVPAVYVQLYELKMFSEDETIGDYIKSQFFFKDEILFNQFEKLTNEPWKAGPQVLLLLDGFDEIAPGKRFSIGEDIKRWADKPGIQIITSSRYDIHTYVPLGDTFGRVLLQPLRQQNVRDYLNYSGIPLPTTDRQWRVITFPLMLTLYAQVEAAMARIDRDDYLQDFKENNSAGAIIWNYLQREIWRFRKNDEDVIKCVLATEFIAPYIAWKMQKESVFTIDQDRFYEFFDQAYHRISELEDENLPPHIRRVLRTVKIALPDNAEFLYFIIRELCLFIKNGNTYSLMHWQFRDALAAIHLINVSYAFDELPEEWKIPVDFLVMQFIAELATASEADKLWEQNRLSTPNLDVATINMLELQKLKRNYNFSQLNFSGMDFRNISLYPYRIPNSINLQLPFDGYLNAGLMVSDKTFSPLAPSKSITVIALSSDGRKCISGSDEKVIYIWDLDTGQYIRAFKGHEDSICAIAIHPDGKRIISASDDNTLRIWDIQSEECLNILQGHEYPINTIAITSEGRECISGSFDDTLRLWDLDTGQCIKTFTGHKDSITALAVNPSVNKRFFVSGSDDHNLLVWDMESGECLHRLEGHTLSISSLAITPDGKRCISGSDDKTLRIWDLESGQCLRTLEGHSDLIRTIAITPDGKRCISGSADKTLRIWDLESGQCLRTLKGHTDWIRTLSITPDGKSCISGSDDKTLRIWDLESGQCFRILKGHTDWIRTLAITADGKRCISGSDDNSLCFWDLESGQCLRKLNEYEYSMRNLIIGYERERGEIDSRNNHLRIQDMRSRQSLMKSTREDSIPLVCSPDGRKCIIRTNDQTIHVWDLESGQRLWTLQGHTDLIRTLAITPDGKRCISGSDDNTLRIWDIDSGQCLRVLEEQSNVFLTFVTPDGKKCISSTADKTLRIWDLESGQCLRTLEGHTDLIRTLAITPDGKRCISGSDDKTLRIWDLESGMCSRIMEGHDGWINVLAISSDGRIVVSGSDDRRVRIWDMESGRCLRTLLGHDDGIISLAISPDGTVCVTGSNDKTLRIWAMESGQCLKTLEGHNSAIRSLSITPDGKRCISGANDNTLGVWDIESGQCLKTSEGHNVLLSALAVTPDGNRYISFFNGSLFGWNLDDYPIIPIKILPLSIIGVDFSKSIITSSVLKETLWQNGAIV